MSLKAKLVSTIAAVCMVICLLSVGIFAASTGTVNIGGSVSFEASDVNVKITGAISGAADNTWADGTAGVEWDATDATAAEVWDGLDLTFVKDPTTGKLNDITITLTVQNKSTERGVNVSLAADPDKANDTTSITVSYSEGSKIEKSASAENLNSKEYKITIKANGDGNTTITGAAFGALLTVTNAK